MNITQINTTDGGGAFQAAYRLQKGLRDSQVSSDFLVLHKHNNLKGVSGFLANQSFLARIRNSISYRSIKSKQDKILSDKPKSQFSFAESPYELHHHSMVKNADIIHLHWVANFLDYPSFFKNTNKPIVWTLHDMNPFSGGFHYKSYEHIEYNRVDTKIKNRKKEVFRNIENLHIVTLSKWMYDASQNSNILGNFPHYLIPNGLNTDIFQPILKEKARTFFDLPQDKKIILFVADSLEDKRKGFNYLLEALKKTQNQNFFLAVLGKGNININNIDKQSLGFIAEPEKIAMAYSAADVFVIPSLEDNLPNTVLESLACGTPVVGFDVGGIPDMIRNGKNGYLAKLKNSDDLAAKITKILENDTLRNQMSKNARKIAETEYNLDLQASRYIELYQSIL